MYNILIQHLPAGKKQEVKDVVRIITDSAADFEPEELKKMNVACVPLSVSFGQAEYQENINLSKNAFYEMLLAGNGFPCTSQPSPGAFERLFVQGKGEDTVMVTLSSALSGTWQGARAAKERLGARNCYVVDSRNATGGQRLVVEEAVRLRDAGKNGKEIARALEVFRKRIALYACIDTLEYLYRGGRIPRSAYVLGSAARLKPIITVTQEGLVENIGKTLGLERGMDSLAQKLEKLPPDPAYPIYIMYTDSPDNGERFAARLKKKGYKISRRRLIQVGAAIGSHIGPGGVGVVYVAAEGENRE